MRSPGEGYLHVKLNQGGGFGPEQQWPLPDWGAALPGNFADNLAFLSTSKVDAVTFRRTTANEGSFSIQVCFILCASASGFYSQGSGTSLIGFEDIDGDGKADQVLKVDGDPNVYAKLSLIGKSNLLKTVHSPLGGAIAIDYNRQGNLVAIDPGQLDQPVTTPQINMPANQWVLASTTTQDGMGNSYTHTYQVDPNGFYDPLERENYGYASMTTTREDGSQVVQRFAIADYYHRGLPTRSIERDAQGNIFIIHDTQYQPLPSGGLASFTGSFFPGDIGHTTSWYEGSTTNENAAAPKANTVTRSYDALGNLNGYVDFGDNDVIGTDDLSFTIAYYSDTQNYIYHPNSVIGWNVPNVVLRKRTANYYANGALQNLTNHVIGGKDPTTGAPLNDSPASNATWQYVYDAYGNLSTVTDPNSFVLAYTYDAPTQTYRTSATDSFGYASESVPNYLFGTTAQETDVNGHTIYFCYDAFGRETRVYGPNDTPPTGSNFCGAASAPSSPRSTRPTAFSRERRRSCLRTRLRTTRTSSIPATRSRQRPSSTGWLARSRPRRAPRRTSAPASRRWMA